MKKSVYVCPTCHARGPRSARTQVASLHCCMACSSFVQGAKAPKPIWLFDDQAYIQKWKMSNPRFPHPSTTLMEEVIRAAKSEGKYSGRRIVPEMNKILAELAKRLRDHIRRYDTYSVVFNSLRILDELYFRATSAEWQLAQGPFSLPSNVATAATKNTMQQTGMIGQPLERVFEVALATRSSFLSSPCTKEGLLQLFELAYEMAQVHYCVESFLCLWRRGTLRVTDSEWHFEPDAEDENRFRSLLENLAAERSQKSREALRIDSGHDLSACEFGEALQDLRKGRPSGKPTKLGADLDEFILAIDDAHRDQFGHSFAERLSALFFLGQPSKELPEDWAFGDKVTVFLQERLNIDGKTALSILDVLALGGEDVVRENAGPFLLRRKFRLMRRPLPKLTVGDRVVYFMSSAFIGRAVINLVAEYMNGSHPELEGTPIQRIGRQLNQRNAKYFVSERVAKPLREHGLVVEAHIKQIGKLDLEALRVGEIDILAFKPGVNRLIVGEGKFTASPDIHVRQMRHDLADYLEESKGYADKLRHKAEWVTRHTAEVLEHMRVEAIGGGIECIPVFFTNLYSTASEFVTDIPFVKERELAVWTKNIR